MDGVEPPSVLWVAHCPFAWWDVVVILGPISVRDEFYPWELGVVVLVSGVGLSKLHQTTCNSVLYVYIQVVGIVELVDEILWVVFIAYVWYRFVISGVGSLTVCVRTEVEEVGCILTRWLGAHLGIIMLIGVGSAATRCLADVKAPAAALVWARTKAPRIANGSIW